MNKIKNLLRFFACFLIFALTIEVCARVQDKVLYGAPFLGQYKAADLRSSEGGIPYNVPNARFEKWKNNNLGFRGADLALDKGAGTTRVVCLGASESYGLYESSGKEWPAQMQELVAGKGLQVINASVVGLSITKYEAYVRKHVLKLKPDVIVLSVNPVFFAAGLERAPQSSTSQPTTPLKKNYPSSIGDARVLAKLKQAVKQALTSHFPEQFKKHQVKKLQNELKYLEKTKLKSKSPLDAVPENYEASFREELEKLIRFGESQGIKMVLMTYPSLMSSQNLSQYPEIFLDSRRFSVEYSLAGMVDILDKSNATIRSTASSHGIALVDASAVVPRTTEYFGDNVHYSDRGAKTIAEHVAKEITGHVSRYVNANNRYAGRLK